MSLGIYQAAMKRLLAGDALPRNDAGALMRECLTGGLEPPQIAALLTALATRAVTVDELTGFASVMRELATPVRGPDHQVDTCGTGGSGLSTTNTSTLCAFVLAAAGVPVAKHGNRASSGLCGSMDVLEQLGVAIDLPAETATSLLAREGLVFLFAPLYHPAMRHVGPVRKALGFRTVFNFLGPLCNPAGAKRQLLGVSDPEMAPLMAATLAELGSARALVVWGEDGLDELSLSAPTRTWELRDGEVTGGRVTPEEVGLRTAPLDALTGGGLRENALLFQAILSGKEQGPRHDHLLLNAGAALYVADRVESIAAGVEQARAVLDSGEALACFQGYRVASQDAKVAH